MNSHVRDCLVTNYEYLIPNLELPDPDDRHVLAAAIKGNADVIVTTNLVDFPQSVLEITRSLVSLFILARSQLVFGE